MQTLPPYSLIIGIFTAWLALVLIWSRYIRGVTESRRIQAAAQGETPPNIKGVSNYERADVMERVHRDMQMTHFERWIGRGLYFAVPSMLVLLFIRQTSF